MKQSLRLKTNQNLSMTPELQQAIRLLQLSLVELEQEIEDTLATNPLLERVEAPEISLQNNFEHIPSVKSKKIEAQEANFRQECPEEMTLHHYLLWQMETSHFSPKEKVVAKALIDSITDDGYLLEPIEEIKRNLEIEASIIEITSVLEKVQEFEPTGVGSRNLAECLLIQLKELPSITPWLNEAKIIIKDHLTLLAERNHQKIKQSLKIDSAALKPILALLTSLSPKPGSTLFSKSVEVSIPDIVVTEKNGDYQVELNPTFNNSLKVNNHCENFIKNSSSKDSFVQFKQQFKEAKWFLKALETRNATLIKVTECIVQLQKSFFEQGENSIKPLSLQEVASLVHLHESTISRVTHQKVILTPRGLFQLKFFFSKSHPSETGESLSTTAIRAIIKKIVQEEPSQNPHSDYKIKELLVERGIAIARRTITKYREMMRIPSSHERRYLKLN